jgi:hypothetical protein
MQRAHEALHHYFSPLTWSLAWLMGRLQKRPETVPTYCDWLNGCRYVTPAGRNIFKDLGFPPDKAEELQRRTYLKILEEMNIGSTDCTEVKTLALETFGDPRLAVEWLQEENTVLRMSPAVEEVLLREVILRFRKGVETQRLVGVSVGDDDYAQVNAGMSKCSNYAHDKAMMGGVAVPDPDELLADILTLENWRALVHKRSEDTAKKRKAGLPIAGVEGMQGAPA